jgi:hypothetical protein
VYDATASATVTGGSADMISGDNLSFGNSAAFADKTVGTGKTHLCGHAGIHQPKRPSTLVKCV